ncbi:MAG: HAMP domain-containing protein [Anaerolineae bacterium]|nr:HAMP domain-containing protein [Anaerolineae bacterium]
MNKLWVRFSLGFSGMVLLAVFGVALAGFLAGVAEQQSRQEVELLPPEATALAEDLSNLYQKQQDWSGSDILLLRTQAESNLRSRHDRYFVYVLTDTQKNVIYSYDSQWIGQPLPPEDEKNLISLQTDNQIVGYLGFVSALSVDDNDRPSFLHILGQTLFTAAGLAAGGGILFGILMSRTLTAPLNSLVEAARSIGARDLSKRVEEKGTDEIIAVARAFNEMAADLEEGEQLRRNLLADVAHELRTPLTVVQGNLRAILDEVYPLDQSEMARLYEQTRLLSRLVNDLHELAQAEAKQLPLNRETTDIVQLVSTVSDTFRPSAEAKGITLHREIAPDTPSIAVDAARLTQVLQNLLANALRHTSEGGSISIQTKLDGDYLRLAVADTGEGISPDHLPHVFDRFYRADQARTRDRGGAGLGLAIVRALVEAHGGSIKVESPGVPGQGSTFTILLPLLSVTSET